MLRKTVFVMLALCLAMAMSTNVSKRHEPHGLTSMEEEESYDDSSFVASESGRTAALAPLGLDLGLDLGSLILAVKDQFKDIIIEIGFQVIKYVISVFHECKVRLLKRLGRYTLSDVFHLIFDGVADFVIESSPAYADTVVARPLHVLRPFPYNHPMAPLFRSD